MEEPQSPDSRIWPFGQQRTITEGDPLVLTEMTWTRAYWSLTCRMGGEVPFWRLQFESNQPFFGTTYRDVVMSAKKTMDSQARNPQMGSQMGLGWRVDPAFVSGVTLFLECLPPPRTLWDQLRLSKL